MKPYYLATAILLSLVAVSAYDLETRDGRVFKEIRLREKTPLGIKIAHENGVTWLDYSEIPVPHLWTFGFNEAEYNAAKTIAPIAAAPTRPTRLYQAPAAPQVERPPIGTTTALSQPARPVGGGGGTSYTRSSSSSSRTSGQSTSGTLSETSRGQCAAITKKGYRCSRMASGGSYCWQHP